METIALWVFFALSMLSAFVAFVLMFYMAYVGLQDFLSFKLKRKCFDDMVTSKERIE